MRKPKGRSWYTEPGRRIDFLSAGHRRTSNSYRGATHMNTHDDELEPTPQDWGFPENARTDQWACWYRQERFLEAFAKCGQIGKAAKAVGITRRCVQLWQSSDVFSFRKRLEDAHMDYAESLEADFDNWVNESKHNTQIARIFRLKAVWPEKYREEVKVLNTDASLRMLEMLRELGKKELEAIEGEYRELPGPAAEPPRPDPGPGPDTDPGLPPTPPERTPEPPRRPPSQPQTPRGWGVDRGNEPPPRKVKVNRR